MAHWPLRSLSAEALAKTNPKLPTLSRVSWNNNRRRRQSGQ